MKSYERAAAVVGLTLATAFGATACGGEKPSATKQPTPAPKVKLSPEGDPGIAQSIKSIDKDALSGCDLQAAQKKLRTAIAKGSYIRLLTIRDGNREPAQSVARNSKTALINPAALACGGEITALVGTSENMKATVDNNFNPVKLVRETDEDAGMLAVDHEGRMLDELTFVATPLHFDRQKDGVYLDGLADKEGTAFASALPVDVMDELAAQQAAITVQ